MLPSEDRSAVPQLVFPPQALLFPLKDRVGGHSQTHGHSERPTWVSPGEVLGGREVRLRSAFSPPWDTPSQCGHHLVKRGSLWGPLHRLKPEGKAVAW